MRYVLLLLALVSLNVADAAPTPADREPPKLLAQKSVKLRLTTRVGFAGRRVSVEVLRVARRTNKKAKSLDISAKELLEAIKRLKNTGVVKRNPN